MRSKRGRWKNIYKVKTKDGKVKELTTLEAVDDIEMMYVVYVHGGAVTLLDIPSGGNRMVK